MTTSENTSLSRNQQHTAVTARPSTVLKRFPMTQESDLLYVDGKKNKLFLNIDRSIDAPNCLALLLATNRRKSVQEKVCIWPLAQLFHHPGETTDADTQSEDKHTEGHWRSSLYPHQGFPQSSLGNGARRCQQVKMTCFQAAAAVSTDGSETVTTHWALLDFYLFHKGPSTHT